MRAAITILLAPLLLGACGEVRTGEAAYREGRYEEAHAAFAAAGDDAPPEVLVNRAMAALGSGRIDDAEAAARRAAEEGDAAFEGLRDFLLGNAAYARCEQEERLADTPEAEPFAFDIALAYGRAARDAWQRAAASRDDWPEARRNVERALLKLRDLARKKAAKELDRKRESQPRPRIIPRLPEDRGENPEEAARLDPSRTELPPEKVLDLLRKLREKEREKETIRRARRGERAGEVEKDW